LTGGQAGRQDILLNDPQWYESWTPEELVIRKRSFSSLLLIWSTEIPGKVLAKAEEAEADTMGKEWEIKQTYSI